MNHTSLYFIAIVPDEDLQAKIKTFKEECREAYQTKQALKLPAHITLQKPFRIYGEEEPLLYSILDNVAKSIKPFSILLSGFECFAPKVIYLNVQNPKPVLELHSILHDALQDRLGLDEETLSKNLKPHITIASRDLSKPNFRKAWKSFKGREFEAEFLANDLTLFKHNGKTWDSIHDSGFNEFCEKN